MDIPPNGLLEEMRAEKDEAYRQRNHLVAALAHLFPSGIRKTELEGWDPEWHGCVYIDLPSGQISYHYHDGHAHLFADLPPYTKEWDGHDKDTVHFRLGQLSQCDRLMRLGDMTDQDMRRMFDAVAKR